MDPAHSTHQTTSKSSCSRCCCAESTFFKISLFIGGIFFVLGTLALLSQTIGIYDGFFGEVFKITVRTAEFLGTEPLNFAIYTIALSGAFFAGGLIELICTSR